MNMNIEYLGITESEWHYNETQAGIRNHAATWMLAAFAATSILLKSEDKMNWLVSPAVLVGVVSIMATLGLLAFWINDQLAYQRLPDCGFIIALKMAYDNPQLSPIRAVMTYSAWVSPQLRQFPAQNSCSIGATAKNPSSVVLRM